MEHFSTVPLRPKLAIDTGVHLQTMEIADLIHGNDPRANGSGEILAFGRAESDAHLIHLDISCTEVIHTTEAVDVFQRIALGDVLSGFAHNQRHFQLIIELFNV